jgi:predicted dehydrogenase
MFADEFDGAIVALPHTLHERACSELLRAGKSVLVEKPMATTAAEAGRMIAVADSTGSLLAVGLMRRYQWAHRLAHELIAGGALGAIHSFDFREGSPYNWPVASDFFFRRESAGGGVLMDTGAHTIDSLLWWLGPAKTLDYRDDASGGVEADCMLELQMASGARGVVELSRTRSLRNTAIIEAENGRIEVAMGGNAFSVRMNQSRFTVKGNAAFESATRDQQYLDLIVEQLSDWTEAVRSRGRPAVGGRDALASIELIEQCYANKRPWLLPWAKTPAEEVA